MFPFVVCSTLLAVGCGYRLATTRATGSLMAVHLPLPDVTASDEPRLAADLTSALVRALGQRGVALEGQRAGPAAAARLVVRVQALEPVSVAVRGGRTLGERWRLVLEARLRERDGTLLWRSGLVEARGTAPLPTSMGSAEASRAALRQHLAARIAEQLASALVAAAPRRAR